MEPTPNTRNKFFRKLLIDVKNNDLEAVKRKMHQAKELFDGKSYGILKFIYEHAQIDIFQIIVSNIGPFYKDDVQEMYVQCYHESKLDKLEILMDRHPDIHFDASNISCWGSYYVKGMFAVLDLLSKRPKQVMCAKKSLIELFEKVDFQKKMREEFGDNNTQYDCEDIAYKLMSVPEFFKEHEIIVVLLRFSRCKDAQRYLEAVNVPQTIPVLSPHDISEIYDKGNVEAIQLLLKYYYRDTFLSISSLVIKTLCERLDMTCLTELFDIALEKKELLMEDIQICFHDAFLRGQLVNLSLLHERFPEVDIAEDLRSSSGKPSLITDFLAEDLKYSSAKASSTTDFLAEDLMDSDKASVRGVKYKKVLAWFHTMFPNEHIIGF